MLRHLLYSPEEMRSLSMQMMTSARRGGLQPVAVTQQTPMRNSQAPEGVSHQNLLLTWQIQSSNTHACTSDIEAMMGWDAERKRMDSQSPMACAVTVPHTSCSNSLTRRVLAQASGSACRPRTMPSTSSTGTPRTGTPRASPTWRRLPWRCCCWTCTPPPPRWDAQTHPPACSASALCSNRVDGTATIHCRFTKERHLGPAFQLSALTQRSTRLLAARSHHKKGTC